MGMLYIGGPGRNTADGIRKMHYDQFLSAHGDRADVPNLAILIVAGRTNVDYHLTGPVASDAKLDGIKIMTIGVGSESAGDTMLLREISSLPHILGQSYWMVNQMDLMGLNMEEFLALTKIDVMVTDAPTVVTDAPTVDPTKRKYSIKSSNYNRA